MEQKNAVKKLSHWARTTYSELHGPVSTGDLPKCLWPIFSALPSTQGVILLYTIAVLCAFNGICGCTSTRAADDSSFGAQPSPGALLVAMEISAYFIAEDSLLRSNSRCAAHAARHCPIYMQNTCQVATSLNLACSHQLKCPMCPRHSPCSWNDSKIDQSSAQNEAKARAPVRVRKNPPAQ